MTTNGFIVSEQFFQVLFVYLDHPLIVGCTLTILVIYYKYSQRSRSQTKPEERLDTEDKRDLGLLTTSRMTDVKKPNMLESYTQTYEKPGETSNYQLTEREELLKQQRFGDFASFILSEVEYITSPKPSECQTLLRNLASEC